MSQSNAILGQSLEVTSPAHSYTKKRQHALEYLVKASATLSLTTLKPDRTTKLATRQGEYDINAGRQLLLGRLKAQFSAPACHGSCEDEPTGPSRAATTSHQPELSPSCAALGTGLSVSV